MIEILGMLAALFAGLLAESFMSNGDADEEAAQNDDSPEEHIANSGFELGNNDGMPQSSDTIGNPDTDEILIGGTGADLLFGEGGDDHIYGGDGNDQLGGRAGDDRLYGDFDEDQLIGGDGNDSLDGGADNDTLFGDDGEDTLIGATGDDVLYAGAGNDVLTSDAGQDSLFGGEGHDIIAAGDGNDMLEGGLGDDLLSGGAGTDEIYGDAGNDTLWGNADGSTDTEVDFLNGGAGNDTLMLGAGDYGHGGDGADSFTVTELGLGATAVEITDFNPAEDQLVLLYDPALSTPPTASLQTDGSGNTQVLLDGQVVATLTNGGSISLGDIVLRAA